MDTDLQRCLWCRVLRYVAVLLLLGGTGPGMAQQGTFLVKLSTPVNGRTSNAGDRIRAAVISPESLLNGYIEGAVGKAPAGRGGVLILRFDRLVFKGKTTPLRAELVDLVNSKGHRMADDDERPVTIEGGALRSADDSLWLDEGAELRVRIR